MKKAVIDCSKPEGDPGRETVVEMTPGEEAEIVLAWDDGEP